MVFSNSNAYRQILLGQLHHPAEARYVAQVRRLSRSICIVLHGSHSHIVGEKRPKLGGLLADDTGRLHLFYNATKLEQ